MCEKVVCLYFLFTQLGQVQSNIREAIVKILFKDLLSKFREWTIFYAKIKQKLFRNSGHISWKSNFFLKIILLGVILCGESKKSIFEAPKRHPKSEKGIF